LDQKLATNFTSLFNTEFSPLANTLPESVHLLTFAQQNVAGREATLLRAVNLEQFDSSSHPTVDFNKFFKNLKVDNHAETSLNGVVPKSGGKDFVAQLDTLEIKTFTTKLSKK
jgi:hypothetical protein